MPSTREQDAKRTEDRPWRAWYWTQRWRRIAAAQKRDEPLCRACLAGGILTPATVCDHVTPHRGDPELFWHGPFQSLCASCHSSAKQAAEKGRGPQVLDDDGWPA